MPRYRLLIEYDGSAFSGWQMQPGRTTVQGTLQEMLSTLLRQDVPLIGSGRTDAGVHAQGQVAHFDAAHPVDVHRFHAAANGLLRHLSDGAAVVIAAAPAANDFHARYDAMARTYHYRVSAKPRALERHRMWMVRPEPDWERMNAAAAHLLGEHHFGSFCIAASLTRNRLCTVSRAVWRETERPGDWRFEMRANRFLHGMVRATVGTLLDVGHGRIQPEAIPNIIAARDRTAAGQAAPAHGLTLMEVSYPEAHDVRW